MELLVRERMGQVPITLVRLSTIIGDSRTGVVTGFNAVHHAAVRAGLAKEDDLYGFLDRVELSNLNEVFGKDLTEEEEGPLAQPTGA